jgi:hypothetical protein
LSLQVLGGACTVRFPPVGSASHFADSCSRKVLTMDVEKNKNSGGGGNGGTGDREK